MKFRKLSNTNEALSAIGLGCMGLNFAYGHQVDQKQSSLLLERAIDLGINFWDTADMYANGANESLISGVLVPNRDKIFIATKFGFRHKNGGSGTSSDPNTYIDGSPNYVKQAVENSLKRLKIETIDLYYAHRVDPNIPIEETVGAMADLVHEGKVRYLGLSEASAESLRRASAVHPIAALQSEYSLLSKDIEGEILDTCRELKISLIPYSPLSRGLITATIAEPTALADNDFRKSLPRFSKDNWENNQKLIQGFAKIAQSMGATPAQLAIGWVLSQGEDIIPIPGTKKIKYLEENAAATALELSPAILQKIEALVNAYPIRGDRYSERSMDMLNK
ncbi:aldo/keto reductase [Arachidicoccus ginsenosidivorans]